MAQDKVMWDQAMCKNTHERFPLSISHMASREHVNLAMLHRACGKGSCDTVHMSGTNSKTGVVNSKRTHQI